MEEVELLPLPPDRFAALLGPDRGAEFDASLARARRQFRGRTLWHINSASQGGGVAEMLQSVLCYLLGAGIETRWAVIEGDASFFEVTKRIHHRLHGQPGDRGPLGRAEMRCYEQVLAAERDWVKGNVRKGDAVVLHDPQVLGLAPVIQRLGAQVIWACHIGADRPNRLTRQAWNLLLPYAQAAARCVFSRPQYAWEGLEAGRLAVIPPCLDAFSAKNQPLGRGEVQAILEAARVVPRAREADPRFVRQDGSSGRVSTRARMVEEEQLPPGAATVVQVSRWDPLKDHAGLMTGFTQRVPLGLAAHLVLAGPDPESVADDPEGQATYGELEEAWRRLPRRRRERVHLACLPMVDLEENAAIVNALQRRASLVVQKSLAEGFGLTVAEAMWKSKPVVGSGVGGIQDQIQDGATGLLLSEPRNLGQLGSALVSLLEDPHRAQLIGKRAHRRVGREYLAPTYLTRYLNLIGPQLTA